MKRLSNFLIVFLLMISTSVINFAEATEVEQTANNTANSTGNVFGSVNSDTINNTLNTAGNTAMNIGQNILDQVTSWALPFCALLIVWGAVLYFVLGIRNLYRKRQGLLLMFGSLTFYVIAVFANLILSFMTGL